MEIKVTPNQFIISFPYRPDIVAALKRIKIHSYNPANKTWTVPREYSRQVEVFAHRWGFRWSVINVPEQDYTIPEMPDLDFEIPLKMSLRHYQRSGVAYGLLHKKIINADDMGLGKTGQAIATIEGANILYQQTGQLPAFPCLVITLASTKYHWLNQWREWTGRNYAMILDDRTKRNYHKYLEANMCKIHIVNFDSLEKFFVVSVPKKKNLTIADIVFDERVKCYNSVIIDECHKVKDEKILRSKITKGIATGKNYIIGLTGTPCVNTPRDVAVQLGIIDQIQKFGGWLAFLTRYCAGEKKASNLPELNYMLNKHCFFRRSKQEVAKELPPKSRQVIHCDITTRKEYDAAKADLINYLAQWKEASDAKLKSAARAKVMVQMGVLKAISARGKLNTLTEFIDNTIEQGEKICVFVHLKETAGYLKSKYPHFGTILGSDTPVERQAAIKRFISDEKCKGMILSIKSAGTGVDGLQKASSTVAFLELPWHPADSDQCEDRLNRIGQTKPVNSLWFLGKDTIDTYIFYDIIEAKRDIANTVTGNTDEVETNMINDILNLFNKK